MMISGAIVYHMVMIYLSSIVRHVGRLDCKQFGLAEPRETRRGGAHAFHSSVVTLVNVDSIHKSTIELVTGPV